MNEVEFYDKQVQYEERRAKIQQERAKLEMEFDSLVRSDKKLQSIQLLRLKSYWEQVCDREKKARIRNEKILRDFSEMERKLATIHKRTAKLKEMKKEYEEEIIRLYPKWRQEIEITKAKRQLEERGFNFSQNNQQPPPTIPKNQPHGPEVVSNGQQPTALFQLVPYSTNHNAPHSVVMSSQVSPVTAGKPQNVASPGKSVTSSVMSPKVRVPPLNLPHSGERDLPEHPVVLEATNLVPGAEKPAPNSHHSVGHQAAEENDSQTSASGDMAPKPITRQFSVESKSAEPVSSIFVLNDPPRLNQVEISDENPPQSPDKEDKNKSNPFFTDESSISDIDEIPSLDFIQDNSRGNTARSLKSLSKANENQQQQSSSPLRSPHKLIVPIPTDREDNVQEGMESVLSETLTTETSPRTDAPLTSSPRLTKLPEFKKYYLPSAAYKELKQQHHLSNTFDKNGDFIEDYAEGILSPKSKNESLDKSESLSESESDVESTVPKSPIVKIPTALDSGQVLNSSKETNPSQVKEISFLKKKEYKAPWDTDSSDGSFEYDNNHGALDDDDFDFYD